MLTCGLFLRFRPPCRILSGYFASAPLAHALFRSAEALAMCGAALETPVLDLGCGAGEFASHAFDAAVDAGLDVDGKQLAKADATQKYGRLIHADARRIPVDDAQFCTVLSVSALEHFTDPDAVLGEVQRVLRPGGTFVGTVVLADLHQHLFYPRLLRWFGLRQPARWYEAAQDRCFNHRTLLAKEDWETLFGRHGLCLLVSKRILSPRLTRWWDLLLPAALPGRLLRRHLVWRPGWLARRLARWLEPYARAEEEQGGVLLFVAEKPRVAVAAKTLTDGTATCDPNTIDFTAADRHVAPTIALSNLVVQ